ncbi:MAG: hypothetical protein IJ804_07790 [Prevotella sp.]|nr:hypothetical protein [Prevotella sp.]
MFLTLRNLAVPFNQSSSKAAMTLMGMYYPYQYSRQPSLARCYRFRIYTYGVGFGVARSD